MGCAAFWALFSTNPSGHPRQQDGDKKKKKEKKGKKRKKKNIWPPWL
jgi:hypothetical protein